MTQRPPELGIRKALGASEGDLRRLVLGEGLRLAAVAIAVDAGLALIGSRVLESLVFGVSAAYPYTFAAVSRPPPELSYKVHDRQSPRSDSIGSTLAARRAGT